MTHVIILLKVNVVHNDVCRFENWILSSLRSPLRHTSHRFNVHLLLLVFQVDSPLNLKHPHDLVIFMRQETRVNYLKKLEVIEF